MRIATALAVGLLFTAGASSACAGDTDAALTQYIETLNAHMPPHPKDGAAIAQFFAEDAVHQDMFRWPPPEPQRGRDEITAFFNGFGERWTDYRHVERRRVVSGNAAVWEGTGQGTWKATGKPVEFPMIMSLEFNDVGEIAASRVYLDPGRIRAQAQ
jgi:ketosteroid isomerase-like protein